MSLIAAAPLSAQPIPAATPEAILCTANYVAMGRVIDAVNADCRAEPKVQACAADNVVDLKMEIIELLGVTEAVGRPPERGAVVAIRVHAFPRLAITATPPPAKPVLSDRQIQETFAGKTFIFSAVRALRVAGQVSATLWPMSEKIWVLDTMSRQRAGDCPRRL